MLLTQNNWSLYTAQHDSAQVSGSACCKYVAAASFVLRSFCSAVTYCASVQARATAQNCGARPWPNFSMKFSFKWWQQCAAIIRGPRIGSARSKPLSWSEIKVHASCEIVGIARCKWQKNHSHKFWFSNSTTAQASIVLWPLASMPTVRRSVCIKRAFKKVPSTATKRRKRSKHSHDSEGAMKKQENRSIR